MVSRLGPNQLRLLSATASPYSLLLTPDRQSDRLVQLGLLRQSEVGKACCITPAGLRALADAIEAGRLKDGLQRAADERAKNEAMAHG